MVELCKKCDKPLSTFAIYIPDIGECCMGCWREYANGVDSQTAVKRKVNRDEV